jgi:drug/metabolite transporter (DMT)-like permease
MNSHKTGTIQLLLSMVILGTYGIFAQHSGLDAATIIFFRCTIGAIILGVYCYQGGYLKLHQLRLLSKPKILLAILSGIAMAINWTLFLQGMQQTSISIATTVYQIQPFLVVIGGILLFHETFTYEKLLCLGLSFIGLLLATGIFESTISPNYIQGIGYVILAATMYAAATLISKYLKEIKPHLLTFIQCTVSTLLLIVVTPLGKSSSISMGQWGWLVGMGIIHTSLAYVLLYAALPKLKTANIAVLLFVYPASAILFDFIFNHKALSIVQFLGLSLMTLTSIAITRNWRFNAPSSTSIPHPRTC